VCLDACDARCDVHYYLGAARKTTVQPPVRDAGVDARGDILAALAGFPVGIIRVDPVTGAQSAVSLGGSLVHPRDIAVVVAVSVPEPPGIVLLGTTMLSRFWRGSRHKLRRTALTPGRGRRRSTWKPRRRGDASGAAGEWPRPEKEDRQCGEAS
jgi:hypothetical protein